MAADNRTIIRDVVTVDEIQARAFYAGTGRRSMRRPTVNAGRRMAY